MSNNSWMQKFALYAASQFRLGNIIDAGFTASVLFENYIEDEMNGHSLRKSRNGDFLRDAIEQLSELDGRKYNFTALDALRKIRNRSVIHNDRTFASYNSDEGRRQYVDDIFKLVEFVWETYDREGVSRYQSIEAIPHIHADLAILAVKEFFEPKSYQFTVSKDSILPDDFNDLIHMRKHFLQLGDYLQKKLLPKYNNLEVDLISHVDTSSGYVWLAINHKRPAADHQRDRIRHSSASIFATPRDLRISIDFGCEDYLGRADYYRFLETDELRRVVAANDQLQCIDLEWYSFVTSCEPAAIAFADTRFPKRVAAARDMLNAIKAENRIVTFERMLLGYVLPHGKYDYAQIADMLDTMIALYYRLEKYRRDKLDRKNHLAWVPEGI